jgi:hypothetical protein
MRDGRHLWRSQIRTAGLGRATGRWSDDADRAEFREFVVGHAKQSLIDVLVRTRRDIPRPADRSRMVGELEDYALHGQAGACLPAPARFSFLAEAYAGRYGLSATR